MDELNTTSEGISRRTVIKRAGVVGAVAWTAPVLSSMGAKAFAGTPAACASCGPDACGGQTDCSPAGGFCTCIIPAAGGCFCHEPSFCSDLPACGPGLPDCPAGWSCASSCCPGGTFCHPPCGTQAGGAGAAAAKGQGVTSVG